MPHKRKTLKQGARLTAKKDFLFKTPGIKGRPVTVRSGQRFWVTNSMSLQESSNVVTIDREGKGHISHGYAFDPNTIDDLFDVSE